MLTGSRASDPSRAPLEGVRMEPRPTRPTIPAEYGVPADTDSLLPWSHVEERMSAAVHFWLATLHPNGVPQSRPIAGMWVERRFYFGGGAGARWLRNLTQNPRASLTLEDAEKAVILEGEVHFVRPDAELADRIVAESNRKYRQDQKRADYEGVEICEFTPRVVLAWKVLNEDATRWELE